jgi:dienelactone hydrolase
LALLATLVRSADAAQRDMDIPMSDGIILRGTYFSAGAPGPAVLLLHQCNMDRRAWFGVAADLSRAGMHVLTVDFRGFGESGGKPVTEADRQSLSAKWPADVDAALAFLLAQQGVDQSRIAVGGASCAVPQASNLAMRQSRIRALLVLSGPATADAKSYLSQTPGLAVFGAAGEQDAGAVEGIKDLLGASRNPVSTLKLYPGSDHGVELLTAHKELGPLIVSWLKTQLIR